MAKVSVIVPVYNGGKHLKETLDSILDQEVDLEVLAVDDGSTDNSAEIIKEIKDKRLTYLFQKNSGNPAGPRNLGIEKSTGNFIAFCDQDDIWYKDKLKKQLTAFEESEEMDEIGIVACSSDVIDEKGKITGHNHLKEEFIGPDEAFNRLIVGDFITACSALVPRKVLERFGYLDENLTGVDDYDLWLRITTKYGVLTLKDHLCAWRESKKALSADRIKLYKENEKIFKKLEDINPKAIKLGHAKNLIRIIVASILQKDYENADKYISKIKRYPVSNKAKLVISVYKRNKALGLLAVRVLKSVGIVQI